MTTTKVILAGIAFLIGGWLVFDGTRALVTGTYTTAKNGPYAGQLGPWSRIVSALGLDPRGLPIKCVHVALGACWLMSIVTFFLKPGLGWWALFFSSVFSLWYLPVGTLLSLIEIGLLFLPQIRNLR